MAEESNTGDAKNAAIAYWQQFQNDRKSIQAEIDSVAGPDAPGRLDGINARLSALEKSFSIATSVLPSYDQRQCSEQLRELVAAYNAKKTSLAPKSKFSFKTKRPADGADSTKTPLPKPVAAPAPRATRSSGAIPPPPGSIVFSNLENQLVTLDPAQFGPEHHADVYLSDLKSCVVDLRCSFGQVSRLQAERITDCVVMTGTLSGSALIYGTTGTLWIIVSQQVRIHDALDADFYLKVGSKPIIETCRNLGFAPYLGGEPSERNLWAEVEDFNWLRQQPSPNWTVITEPERISDVDGLFARAKEGANAVDLLKASLRRQ